MASVRGGVGVGGAGAVTAHMTVLGLPEAIAKLTGVGRVCRITLGLITRTAAETMAARAKSNIHHVTHNLEHGTYATQRGPYLWEVVSSSMEGDKDDKNDKEYSRFVEFGTSKMEPRGYMTKAFEETVPQTMVAIKALASAIQTL